ncbi:tail fiber protein [uncultured Thalassospira sp.]|uniref:phage tail protein n=1 Tax=uncultured Thalassospira sp. TaxID=404382 RepID=UPI0025945FBA|nr:tail fiber protein [uncultured Thalassospira sp.]|tara:strand:- start:677 stop:1252 length:576 start_codon:yes stop_codon:yes gene_type:complete
MSNTFTVCTEYEISQFAAIAVPTGALLPFAGVVAPSGYLICDGGEVSKELFADLYAVIGDAFGVAGVGTDFKLPDMRGRAPVGAGLGDGLSDRVLGAFGGEEAHQLTVDEMPNHNHGGVTSTNGNHSHSAVGGSPSTGALIEMSGQAYLRSQGSVSTSSSGAHNHTISAQGGDQPHNNMQPFVVINYIIKV